MKSNINIDAKEWNTVAFGYWLGVGFTLGAVTVFGVASLLAQLRHLF